MDKTPGMTADELAGAINRIEERRERQQLAVAASHVDFQEHWLGLAEGLRKTLVEELWTNDENVQVTVEFNGDETKGQDVSIWLSILFENHRLLLRADQDPEPDRADPAAEDFHLRYEGTGEDILSIRRRKNYFSPRAGGEPLYAITSFDGPACRRAAKDALCRAVGLVGSQTQGKAPKGPNLSLL